MMIAPALFMTATGSLILSSNQRLARIVDRIRILIDLCDKLDQPGGTQDCLDLRRKYLAEEIGHLKRRNQRIRVAIGLFYLAFTTFVSASLAIGIDMFLKIQLPNVSTVLALCGVVILMWGSINMFQETIAATRTLSLESRFLDDLQAERKKLANKN
ncbi:MAG: DUF2721 domain-containing protein [Planctomycetes bacterium]|nr:DUF2721 domain-containing protein [Planctomycetota bacterium]